MKRVVIYILSLMVTFGCSKEAKQDVVDKDSFTEAQISTMSYLNGEWYDIQFAPIINGKRFHGDVILWGTVHDSPVPIYDDYGNFVYTMDGNCNIYKSKNGEEITLRETYGLSKDGKRIVIYNDDKNIYGDYELNIVSDTEIHMLESHMTEPYIFIKSAQPTKSYEKIN